MIKPGLQAHAATERLLRGRSVLTRTSLFQQLTPLEIDWVLSRLEPACANAGHIIIRQGEPGDRFYLLVAGTCQVWREQPNATRVPIAQLGAGDYFGEIALLHAIPRTATVTAETRVDLLTLSRADFGELFGEQSQLEQPLSDFRQACYSTAAARLAQLDREVQPRS
jgi:CRP-like cAMP-binding protein